MAAAGTAGGIAGGIIGGAILGPILPPIGGLIGRWAGRALGRAAAEALANMMDDANEEAEDLSESDATTACAECGEIDCFNPPDGVDPEEFRRQLKEQQDALREMKPQDILDNMAEYAANGRPAGDAAARRAAREGYVTNNLPQRIPNHMGPGVSIEDATALAREELLNEIVDQDATHVVDLIAGGDGGISGLGNRSVNRSIGSQWRHRGTGSDRTRAQQLKDYAEQAEAEGADMSGLELNMCGDENGGDTPTGTGDPGAGQGTQGGEPGNVPMS